MLRSFSMTEFTKGQVAFMHQNWQEYRLPHRSDTSEVQKDRNLCDLLANSPLGIISAAAAFLGAGARC